MSQFVDDIVEAVKAKNPGEVEFHQAVVEVAESIELVYEKYPHYRTEKIFERMVEPERVIMFRVPWMDDLGEIHVNRGFRIEMNSALGPYKGGLRFHASVNLSNLKFLGFEQVFKNSLTTLPMGGGKGGADFNPTGKSDSEIMRFCQSFMTELFRHIGPNTDVPAGDIGVGGREIGYLFGQYKRIRNEFSGVLTGKGINWGGSLLRPEATGFGVVYMAAEMLAAKKQSIENKRIAISGFGNVAWGAATKATQLGAKVVTISGPDGYCFFKDGMTMEHINYMLDMRASRHDRAEDMSDKFSDVEFKPGRPWETPADLALPCAIQNELDEEDAKKIIDNGALCVCEGANMPCTLDATRTFINAAILYAPGKAANAGGVAVSGLEMTQNSSRLPWTRDEVDRRLHLIMKSIHKTCVEMAKKFNTPGNYVNGANIGGFIKVADAMIDQGLV